MTPRWSALSPVQGERGVALLSALFAVALLTIIVVEMTDATLVHTHLTRNAGNAMAAQLLARSAAIAGEALVSDDNANPSGRTCPNKFWNVGIPQVDVGDGFASVQVSDEAGKLDLNSVRPEKYREVVKTLFSNLTFDPSLVDRVASWISDPSDPAMATGDGSDYCALAMSCTPRHQPLHSLDELLLIRGFDEQMVAQLRRYVTVIPPGPDGKPIKQSLNPLTAAPAVLEAIGCDGSPPPDCPASSTGEGEGKDTEWKTDYDHWVQTSCPRLAGFPLATTSAVFTIVAQGVVGDVQQTVRTTVLRKGDRATRLWWQEAPLRAPTPVEAR